MRLRLLIAAALERSRGQSCRQLFTTYCGNITLKIQHIAVVSFPKDCYSRLRSMNQYAFGIDGVGRCEEKAEGLVRGVGADAKPIVHDELNRHRRPVKGESFSLTIRANDGRTLLEAANIICGYTRKDLDA